MHKPTGNNILGFVLSLNTALLWGILPIAIKEVIVAMDAFTLVWYRFLLAALILFPFLHFRKQLPKLGTASNKSLLLLLIAGVALAGNYVLFAHSLNFINAQTSEALIQLTTLFLLLGGVIVYREPFFFVQKLGALLIVLGLVLFFNDRFNEVLTAESQLGLGIIILVSSSSIWAIYALLQKYLLRDFSSVQILFVLYTLSAVILLPLIKPATLFLLSPVQLALLFFCCLNTVVAYGSFAEALVHWHASKVGAVLALAPLFTIAGLKIVVWFNPDYTYTDHLNWLSLIAAIILVIGSMTVALVPLYIGGGKSATEENSPVV
jgi:drug/metabolite transporter (DMT)-like permease